MTDELLLSEIKDNPSKGFSLLLNEYTPLVFKICHSVLSSVGSGEDARECASDVFASFYKNIDRVDLSKGSIKGLLAFSAKTTAIDYYRRLKKDAARVVSIDDVGDIPSAFLAFEQSEKKEKSRLVAQAVRSLGEPDRTIIVRKYFFGETAAEIGERLSLSAEVVQKRSQRALQKLKKLLEDIPGGVLLD